MANDRNFLFAQYRSLSGKLLNAKINSNLKNYFSRFITLIGSGAISALLLKDFARLFGHEAIILYGVYLSLFVVLGLAEYGEYFRTVVNHSNSEELYSQVRQQWVLSKKVFFRSSAISALLLIASLKIDYHISTFSLFILCTSVTLQITALFFNKIYLATSKQNKYYQRAFYPTISMALAYLLLRNLASNFDLILSLSTLFGAISAMAVIFLDQRRFMTEAHDTLPDQPNGSITNKMVSLFFILNLLTLAFVQLDRLWFPIFSGSQEAALFAIVMLIQSVFSNLLGVRFFDAWNQEKQNQFTTNTIGKTAILTIAMICFAQEACIIFFNAAFEQYQLKPAIQLFMCLYLIVQGMQNEYSAKLLSKHRLSSLIMVFSILNITRIFGIATFIFFKNLTTEGMLILNFSLMLFAVIFLFKADRTTQ